MDAHHFISLTTDALRASPGLRALFLSGSHATGQADSFSDIDFLAVAHEGQAGALCQAWRAALETVEPLVLYWENGTSGRLANAVTESWVRLDLHVVVDPALPGQSQDRLAPLHDPEALRGALAEGYTAPNPARRLTWMIEEFIRVLGLLPVALGRGDLVLAQSGIWHLRNLLTEALILERGPSAPRGMLCLAQRITPDQSALLASLPLPAPDRASIIAAHTAHAQAFLPRARGLAARHEVPWPEAFEAATCANLKRTLGIEV